MVTKQKMSKENRKKILQALFSGAKSWEELKNLTKLADATLAKHIKELLREGLITEEIDPKDRRRKIYKPARKEGLEQLREDLIAFRCAIWLMESWYQHRRDPLEFYSSIRDSIGTFFMLCMPEDVETFLNTIGVLVAIQQPLFEDMPVDKKLKETFKEIKTAETEENLRVVVEYLKGFKRVWLCYANTPKEEMEKIINKYFEGEDREKAIEIYFKLKKHAEKILEALQKTWIGKMVDVSPNEVPTFEELLRAKYESSKIK